MWSDVPYACASVTNRHLKRYLRVNMMEAVVSVLVVLVVVNVVIATVLVARFKNERSKR